jgi:hypothetical protein
MSPTRFVTMMLCIAMAGLASFAPAAGASSPPKHGHFRILPSKPCNAVLVGADFTDGLEEISPPSVMSAAGTTAYVSTCKYASTEDGGLGHRDSTLTDGGIGVECLANGINLLGTTGAAPAGGCFRISSVTVLFARGRPVEKLAAKLKTGVRSRIWPAGYTRHVAPGIGNRAEFGYDGPKGYGYLQVDNATLSVETSEATSLINLLRDAAAVL